MQKLTAMFNIFVGIFQRGGCTTSKSRNTQTRRSATTRYRPWRSMCAKIKRQLLGKWPRGLPHLRESLLFCACVRGGKFAAKPSRQHLEKKYLALIPAWDRDETPFVDGFSDLGNCRNQHSSPHEMYTDRTAGESCIDQDLSFMSGYHKQWPHSWRFKLKTKMQATTAVVRVVRIYLDLTIYIGVYMVAS